MSSAVTDESWPMIEEAVFRLFDQIAYKGADEHTAVGPALAELGWSDIDAEYPIEACELLFRAQGRSLAHTDCLSTVMLAELSPLLDGPVDGIVLPAAGHAPGSDAQRVAGIVLGPLPVSGRLAVPVAGPMATVSLGVVDTDRLSADRLDTFDPTVFWTRVSGPLTGDLTDASTEFGRAIAAAQRALATELVSLADEALRIAVEHVRVRIQFGSPIGSFQSPRHLLADASANLEGARALLDETWRFGGSLSAMTAKAAAGRAHRAISDAALQVCGAIGLTAEHDLHRYVTRGFQIDSLCGSHHQLEGLLAERLFEMYAPGRALPSIVTWG
ncbi:MAG: acyl-CoA dehydrogenase family protein [Mycobacterium sp.]